MSLQALIRAVGGVVAAALTPAGAAGYIHFPPPTLPKLCEVSTHIRVLTVARLDKDKGVVVFEPGEALKGESRIKSFRHAARSDGARSALEWAAAGKPAVMFWIESPGDGAVMACGYVFTDGGCYSVDYNKAGEFWAVIRPEPGRSACYHGPADRLPGLVKDVLAGKAVTVPTREPAAKEDREERFKEVNDVLTRNRGGGK